MFGKIGLGLAEVAEIIQGGPDLNFKLAYFESNDPEGHYKGRPVQKLNNEKNN
uniref:Uncharacterized protein n=1 Tax=viral metagenome TaxID=1070528 RepID=A0A6M3JQ29_9ZZZZ